MVGYCPTPGSAAKIIAAENKFQATYPSVDAVTTATLPDNFLDLITTVKTKLYSPIFNVWRLMNYFMLQNWIDIFKHIYCIL